MLAVMSLASMCSRVIASTCKKSTAVQILATMLNIACNKLWQKKTTCLTRYRNEHTVVFEGLCLYHPARSIANPQIILVRVVSLFADQEMMPLGGEGYLLWYRE